MNYIKYYFAALLLLACELSTLPLHAQQVYTSSGKTRQNTQATKKSKGFDVDKLIYGGGLYGGGSGQIISLGLSPIAGYRFNDYLSAGISLGYKYNFYRDYFSVYNIDRRPEPGFDKYNLNNHIFIPGIWGRVRPFGNFFTHFEFENNISIYKNYDLNADMKIYSKRITESIPCLLLGGGLRQPINETSSFVFYVLYDVLQNIPSNKRTLSNGQVVSKSPYAGTVDIRLGVNIGF